MEEKDKPTVIWLMEAMKDHLTPEQRVSFEGLFQQALEMEIRNIKGAFSAGANDIYDHYKNSKDYFEKNYEL
jgi:hypothetical protein